VSHASLTDRATGRSGTYPAGLSPAGLIRLPGRSRPADWRPLRPCPVASSVTGCRQFGCRLVRRVPAMFRRVEGTTP
jgi:hypothetical protein